MRDSEKVYTLVCGCMGNPAMEGKFWTLVLNTEPGMEDVGMCEGKAAGAEEMKVPWCWRAGPQEENLISPLRSRASAGRLRSGRPGQVGRLSSSTVSKYHDSFPSQRPFFIPLPNIQSVLIPSALTYDSVQLSLHPLARHFLKGSNKALPLSLPPYLTSYFAHSNLLNCSNVLFLKIHWRWLGFWVTETLSGDSEWDAGTG